jgi:hypothetical protein
MVTMRNRLCLFCSAKNNINWSQIESALINVLLQHLSGHDHHYQIQYDSVRAPFRTPFGLRDPLSGRIAALRFIVLLTRPAGKRACSRRPAASNSAPNAERPRCPSCTARRSPGLRFCLQSPEHTNDQVRHESVHDSGGSPKMLSCHCFSAADHSMCACTREMNF